MYIDAYALISHQDGGVGDSLHHEGMYAFGKWMRYNFTDNTVVIEEIPARRDPAAIINKYEVQPGIFVRHPEPGKWTANPNTTSRDQIIPVIAYCAAYKDYPRLWRLFKATAKRGMFAQNITDAGDGETNVKLPDTMMGHLGLFIRGGGMWTMPLYPLLYLTDTADLIGTLVEAFPFVWSDAKREFRRKERSDVDDNNAVIAHLMAVAFKPTPISWLNRQVYALTRPNNLGNTLLGEKNNVMAAIAWYHRVGAGENREIAEVYRPLIEKYFSPREKMSRALATLRSYL